MADIGDSTITPSADQTALSEPKLAEQETKLETNPSGIESDKLESSESKPATGTDIASSAATAAAGTATAVATGVKDSVFSMFGGGVKKEKVVEGEDAENDRSGSLKATKAKEEDEDVCYYTADRRRTSKLADSILPTGES